MSATAVIFWFFEDRVVEYSTDDAGLMAFKRFLGSFGDSEDSFRKQLALMHHVEGLAAFLIVVGMFLFGNFRAGHLFAAIGCAAFGGVSITNVNTIRSYPQIEGNEAMIEPAPQGIAVFFALAIANFIAFGLSSDKPFFPSPEDCNNNNDNKKKSG